MSIISISFLVFLAVVLGIYYVVPKKYQWIVLLAGSYIFYMFSGIQFLGYLLFTTLTTFFCGNWLSKIEGQCAETLRQEEKPSAERKKEIKRPFTRKKRRVLALAMVANFGVLCVVKYLDFAISNINGILSFFKPDGQLTFFNIALPLGISFYIFQSMGYLVDVYRGKVKADTNLFRFALFVSYFPQIIQGPIGRYNQLAHQFFEPHSFEYTTVKFGAQRMLWGYFKKMVIADRIAVVVNQVFGNYKTEGYEGFLIFIAVLLYSIQIYADFSGGMDIVCGASQMLGIELTENFKRPFLAKSVAEFWQRWHITLGAWMKDYLFYPLALSKPFGKLSKKLRKHGGNYVAKVLPTCLASFIVFTLIGVWHGASWKYVVYGIYQATFVSTATLLEPFYAKCRKFFRVQPQRFSFRLFQILRTVFVVTIGRYLSRATALMTAVSMLACTFSKFNPWVFFDGTLYTLGLDQKNFQLMILLIVFLFVIDFIQEKGIHIRETIARQGIVFRWALYFAAIFGIIILGMYGQGFDAAGFIYQGF